MARRTDVALDVIESVAHRKRGAGPVPAPAAR
jgi:hypothetical protein